MSFETNKVLGAILGTITFTLGVSFLSELIFKHEPPEKPGYDVAVAEEAPAGAAPAAAEAVAPIADRLKTADAAKGEASAKACAACHALDSSGANKVGPGLWEVINRTPGTHPGFTYSQAMTDFGKTHTWDYAALDTFLTSPKADVPGTKMGFAGFKKPEDRANVIAYLRTLSANPAPLP